MLGVALGPLLLWAYGPTLIELMGVWNREPDYSHGWMVLPIALYFLWARREDFPAGDIGFSIWGIGLIALSVLARYVGASIYIDSIDAWSIPLWIAGVVWLVLGRNAMMWSLSSIAFLWFMMPLPWRVERLLSYPLQQVATKGSAFILQCLGQPAIAAGNTILIGDHQLEVAQACVGLRMLLGVAAVGVAYMILFSSPWWQKVMLLAAVAPVAIAANLTRITVTALLYQYTSGEAAQTFAHDGAGWLMIPLAAGMFAGVLWWCDRVFVEVEQAGQGELVSRKERRQ